MPKLHFEIETSKDEYDADWLCPANLILALLGTFPDIHLSPDQIIKVKNMDDGHCADPHGKVWKEEAR